MKRKTNSKREVYLDLAKFLAMIMMVAGHSFFEMAKPESYNLNEFPWNWWGFARGKTALIFLFLSGAVHVFANFKNADTPITNETFRRRVTMSLILLFIGYLLNSPIDKFSEIFNISDEKINLFLQVNILHIFGVGLLILAFIYKFAKSIDRVFYTSLFLGIISILVTPYFLYNNFEHVPLAVENYLNFNHGSVFTLFPYISYIFLGTVFGILLKKHTIQSNYNEPEKGFFRNKINIILIISSVLLISAGILISKTFLVDSFFYNKRGDIGVIIRNLGIIVLIIYFAKMIKIESIWFRRIISTLSKRAIYIYVIHLFIIYGIGFFTGLKYFYNKEFYPPQAFLISFGVICFTIIITLMIDKAVKKKWFIYLFYLIIIIYTILFMIQ